MANSEPVLHDEYAVILVSSLLFTLTVAYNPYYIYIWMFKISKFNLTVVCSLGH